MTDHAVSLTGLKALVTGATSGIGEAVAFALAAQGVELVLLGRNREKLETLQTQLEKTSAVSANTYVVDLASDIETLVEDLAAKVGRLDLLIHSAGILISQQSFETSSVADLDLQYRVNLRGPYLITRALLPALQDTQGQVVFVNSSAAQQKTRAGALSYTVTKYGLVALADGLRDQVNAEGIRVISVYPGKTATPMQQQIYAFQNREYRGERMLQADDVAQTILSALVLPRTAEVTDISVRPFLKE